MPYQINCKLPKLSMTKCTVGYIETTNIIEYILRPASQILRKKYKFSIWNSS